MSKTEVAKPPATQQKLYDQYINLQDQALHNGLPPNPYIWVYDDAIPVIELMHHEYKGHYGEKHKLCRSATHNVMLIKSKIKAMYIPCKKKSLFAKRAAKRAAAAAAKVNDQTHHTDPEAPNEANEQASSPNTPRGSTISSKNKIKAFAHVMDGVLHKKQKHTGPKRFVFGSNLRDKIMHMEDEGDSEMDQARLRYHVKAEAEEK